MKTALFPLSLLALAPTFALAMQAPAPVLHPDNIFGPDDRRPMTSTGFPWSPIGKLTIGGGWCTATLVGKDLVVTAAHCVIDAATHTLVTQPIYFHPDFRNGSSETQSYATTVVYGTNDVANHGADDWALIRLADPLGDRYGFMGTQIKDFSQPVPYLILAGYSRDFQNGDTAGVDEYCTIHGDTPWGYVLHDCDMVPGASGGPIFSYSTGQPMIVAINVAERNNSDGSPVAAGLPYDDSRANIAVKAEKFQAKILELRD